MKFKVFSKIRFFFLIYSVMIFSACHDSDKIEPEYGERTVLIYMAADNNLNKNQYKVYPERDGTNGRTAGDLYRSPV